MDHSGANYELDAAEFLKTLSPEQTAYAMLKNFYPGGRLSQVMKLFPTERANLVNGIVSKLRIDIRDGKIMDDDGKPVPFTPNDLYYLDVNLGNLTMREQRNALVVMNVPGWSQREIMDTTDNLRQVEAISPAVRTELERRWKVKGIPSFEAVQQSWPIMLNALTDKAHIKDLFENPESAKSDDIMWQLLSDADIEKERGVRPEKRKAASGVEGLTAVP
jgi:hypothetical protein